VKTSAPKLPGRLGTAGNLVAVKWALFYDSADDLDSKVPHHYPAHRKRVDKW
jgi:hypothetical protein